MPLFRQLEFAFRRSTAVAASLWDASRFAQSAHETLRLIKSAGPRFLGPMGELSTLALIEDYFYLDLKNFVDQMARLSRGVAVYCTAGELGRYVFDSFVSGRRARRQVG